MTSRRYVCGVKNDAAMWLHVMQSIAGIRRTICLDLICVYVLMRGDRECFVPLMTHKFRRSLEPYVNAKPDGPRRTALKPTGNLLIGFSGGLGSSVLLDLVYRCYVQPDPLLVTSEGGKDHPRNERVWKKVTVCYVEVCDAFPGVRHLQI